MTSKKESVQLTVENQLEFFDNQSKIVRDDLEKSITDDSRLSMASSMFSIYAYQELKKQLATVEEFRFLFTSPTFVTNKEEKVKREFYIPQLQRERGIFGSEYEIRLRNELTQKAIARECAEWIKKKAVFRSNLTSHHINHFLNIHNEKYDIVYNSLNGFTTVDLGCERGKTLCNIVTKMALSGENDFLKTFDSIWNNHKLTQDVTEQVVSSIISVYQENGAELIYFMTLYQIFNEFLDDLSEDNLPNEKTGFQNSLIWQTLYDFQRDAAFSIINKIEQYNGCILADSVGLGKTYTALAVIKYYESRNKNVLVLCPKKLMNNWISFRGNLLNNPLANDRFRYDVLFHTDLLRTFGNSATGLPFDQINWGNYDLVVIDESHNFRNGGNTNSNDELDKRENRYQALMEKVIRAGVRTKVLMLSATPVNNRFVDLRNQLALAYEGNPENINPLLNTKTDIDTIFRQAQQVFNAWSKLPVAQRTTDVLLRQLDYDFFKVLDSVTIARSRKHIQKYYDMAEIGAFPIRLPPVSRRPKLTDLNDTINYSQIYARLEALNLYVYAPSEFILPSKLGKYIDLSDLRAKTLSVKGREQGIRRLTSINLLKRMESSVHSFRLTVERILKNINDTIARIDTFMCRMIHTPKTCSKMQIISSRTERRKTFCFRSCSIWAYFFQVK